MITEQKVKSFLLLAEELNFSQTARRLYITQQALSAQISSLESDLGFPLFIRTTKSVRLTEAGEKIATFFRRCEADFQALTMTYRKATTSLLRIGCFENLDLGPLLFQARDALPNEYARTSCQLSVSANYSALLQKLEERSIDLAVMPLGIETPARFHTQVLADDATYAFFSPRFPDASKIQRLTDLKDAQLFAGPEYNGLWQYLHNYFQSNGIKANLVYDPAMSVYTERMVIESGEGVGFGGKYSLLYRNSDLLRLPLEMTGELGAVWCEENRNPVIRPYIKSLLAQF